MDTTMQTLSSEMDPFGGIVVDPISLPTLPNAFSKQLERSLAVWKKEGQQVVWLEIPADKSLLVPVAVDAGFEFHHCNHGYLMLTLQLVDGALVPPFATHYVGAGGIVLNEKRELLVVWEKRDRTRRPEYYKLPGGALQPGENLVQGVIREVFEETGIRTAFESLVCFRTMHGYRHGKSDIYFVCCLTPLTHEIEAQDAEIEDCLWMPVEQFLENDHVGIFNKHVVRAALDDSCRLVRTPIEGYDAGREVFSPPNCRD